MKRPGPAVPLFQVFRNRVAVAQRPDRAGTCGALRSHNRMTPINRTVPTGLMYLILACGLLTALRSAAESINGFTLDDALVPAEQILHGGPGRDGIPSLDDPQFVMADEADFLNARDRVLGIEVNGVKRAYPIRILNYHEIVNDMLGGDAVVITFCPLCGSGIAFRSTIDDERLEFGVSGLLYNSDVLLYDRQSGSLWSQIRKMAVTGPMKGTRLDAIPLAHTTWQDWQSRYPDTEVLSTETGYRRNYTVDPYPNYGRDNKLYFPVAEENRQYPRKALVMGLEIDGQFKAYPFAELRDSPAQFADEFQGEQLSVQYDHGNQTARVIDKDGREVPTLIAFWFAWYAFHPDTEIHTAN